MKRITSGDAEIAYEAVGTGPPVILLHPFPAHHAFWLPATESLSSRYRVILPDLRGHGESRFGGGPATMAKHAADVANLCEHEEVGRAAFVGVSIGGYVLFEFWRRYRERVAALVLCDTRAQADTAEARSTRLQSAADVLERGTEPFVDSMLPRLLGKTTTSTRPEIVAAARSIMMVMSPEGISQVQKGMAERRDSVATLKTIDVPTLILVGEEDVVSPVSDAELMRRNIAGAETRIIPRAGHFGPFEQPEAYGSLLRTFLDSRYRAW